jgi:mRNA-degrading endonuclease RelE of RelBE toxin-antitoxin system
VAYRIVILSSAESDLEQLDPEVRKRILRRIVWLGENASQVIHHPLANMPGELLGLCRFRAGDRGRSDDQPQAAFGG